MNMPLTVTLNAIREHSPCEEGWTKLLKHLGKTKADDEPLPLETVLDSNGFDDTIWCLRALKGYDRDCRLFAVWCARRVEHLMEDQRSRDALDVSERHANGTATDEELAAARDAARDAALAAARDAARDAALAAARDAAGDAAGDAARAAAGDAAGDAAGAAARDAAWATAWAAARDAQAERFRQMCRDGRFIGETK